MRTPYGAGQGITDYEDRGTPDQRKRDQVEVSLKSEPAPHQMRNDKPHKSDHSGKTHTQPDEQGHEENRDLPGPRERDTETFHHFAAKQEGIKMPRKHEERRPHQEHNDE